MTPFLPILAHTRARPLPPGHWLMDVNGSCPRCHHYHKNANLVFRSNSKQSTHLCCENCHRKWFALGHDNSTRVSLVSIETVEADPVEREVRLALISMVRNALPSNGIDGASTQIPGSDRPSSIPYATTTTPGSSQHPAKQGRERFHVPVNRRDGGIDSDTPQSQQNLGKRFQGPISRWRKSLRYKPLEVRKECATLDERDKGKGINLENTDHMDSSTTSQLAKATILLLGVPRKVFSEKAKRLARHPENIQTDIETNSKFEPDDDRITTSSIPTEPKTRAQKFIEDLNPDALDLMSAQERVKWLRNKFTKFKRSPKTSDQPQTVALVDSSTMTRNPPLDEESTMVSISQFLLGLGSRFPHMERPDVSDLRGRTSQRSLFSSDSLSFVQSAPTPIANPMLDESPQANPSNIESDQFGTGFPRGPETK